MRNALTILLGICIFIAPLAHSEEARSENASSSTIDNPITRNSPQFLHLMDNWQFCPTQNFQPTVELKVLDCKPITLPNGWEVVAPDYDGYGLLVTQIEINELAQFEPDKHQLALFFSRIRDADKVYINGQLIGETGEFPPKFQKAVLYSRTYPIPHSVISNASTLEVRVWVYNDARPGGVTGNAPILSTLENIIDRAHDRNYLLLVFIVITFMFSMLHMIYFVFYHHSKENVFYSLFLLSWSIYLFTVSDLAVKTGFSMNFLFRSNIAVFFFIFSSLPFFVYQFFKQQIPQPMKFMLATPILLIPACYLLPEPALVYYPLQLVEVMTLPALIFVYWMLIKAIRAKLAYAKSFSLVLVLYTLFGGLDILIDLLQPSGIVAMQFFGPWALILLSIVMTIIISHKNLVYYKNATLDRLTSALRFDEFLSRLQQEFFRADRENKVTLLIMIDLDEFKRINDSYGHLQGDLLLRKVSDALFSTLRQFDLLCRYGGDEFCIGALFDSREEARKFTERLSNALGQVTFKCKGTTEKVSATLGAALRKPEEDLTPLRLVENADQALISGKANSKGNVYFN